MRSKWLDWAQEILSIAHAGLEYSKNPYDLERYERLRKLSARIVAEYADIETERAEQLFANEKGYQTPKVDVRAIVQDHGKLLFVKENDDTWALPGGWAEPGLSLRENVVKEVHEESGMHVEPRVVAAILDRNRHSEDLYPYSVYKIFILCDLLSGEYVRNIETKAAGFFSERDVPELSTTRNTAAQIAMCFRLLHSERHDVEFD